MNKTLKEFLNGEGLFSAIHAVQPFPFTETPDDVATLDLMVETLYGERLVFQSLAGLSVESAAKMIVLNFTNVWLNYVKIVSLSNQVHSKRELTETITDVENRTNANSNINQVSAFNSETMIDDDGSTTTGSNDLSGERERVLIDERIDNKAAFDVLNTLSKQSIIKSVLNDSVSFLTLSIY